MNNEVMEKLEIFLQNLRCENRNRETLVHLESCKAELKKLQEQKVAYVQLLKKLNSTDAMILSEYIEQLQSAAFAEQQEVYLQGIMDAFQMLSGIGIISINENVEKIIAKFENGSPD